VRYFVGGEEVDERTGRVVDVYLDRQTELGSFEFAAQVRDEQWVVRQEGVGKGRKHI
jgi:hypothetical protein